MPTSAALTIWVASSQIALPITGAVARAAAEILGPNVTVQTAAYPDGHPEATRPPATGERSVRVSWSSEHFDGAQLRLCRTTDDCFERWVAFRPNDPELERGRTVGFLATAVFLESAPAAAAPSTKPTRPVPVAHPKASASAAVAVAAPGDGTGLGARIDADYAFFAPVRLGLGLETRFGELSAAQATSRISSAQVTSAVLLPRLTRALWVGLELGVGVHQLSVSHLSADDPTPNRQNRWLFGGDFCVKLAADMSDVSAVFLAPGVEVLSGSTDIVVHDDVMATWPVAIPISRLGLRAAF